MNILPDSFIVGGKLRTLDQLWQLVVALPSDWCGCGWLVGTLGGQGVCCERNSAIKWVRLWRLMGKRRRAAFAGHRRAVIEPHAAWLLDLIGAQSDITLEDITLEEVRTLLRELGICSRPIGAASRRDRAASRGPSAPSRRC